jgi:hypothetical protein
VCKLVYVQERKRGREGGRRGRAGDREKHEVQSRRREFYYLAASSLVLYAGSEAGEMSYDLEKQQQQLFWRLPPARLM